MNKKILLAASGGILVIIALIVWLIRLQNPGPQTGLKIQGNNNQVVQTSDFISSAPIKNFSIEVLYSDDYFSIQYDNSTSDFLITFNAIYASDVSVLQQSRSKAEAMLLSKLAITETDACKLKVREIIQQSPALNFNSYAFTLSFCTTNDTFPTK